MKNAQFAKVVVWCNSLLPLGLLLWDAYWHHLGANPVEFALRTTGMLALIFLTLSLTVTPLRKMTGWNVFSNFRRMLGVYAFFYAAMHFGIYFGLDRSGSLAGVLADTSKRPFILVGTASLLMMLPLAATSTNWSIKKMGAAKWKLLHKLAYPAGVFGVMHYYMLVKADTTKPVAFAWVMGFFLAYRLLPDKYAVLRKKPRPTGIKAMVTPPAA